MRPLTRHSLLAAVTAASLACVDKERPRPPSVRPEPVVASARDAATTDVVTADLPSPDVAPNDATANTVDAPALPPAPRDNAREEPVPPEEDDLMPPRRMQSVPLPTIPAAVAADVPRYRLLVAHAMRCWETDGRLSHTPSPGCAPLYDQLVAGGATALHAMGTYLVDDAQHHLFRRERTIARTSARTFEGTTQNGGDLINNAERLAPTFARFDAPEVVPYVLMAMSRPIAKGYGDWGVNLRIQRWMDVLSTVTGNDLTPVPPWQLEMWDASSHMNFLADAHDAWCRWYRAHKNESLDAWRAAGLARARADLTARDTARRTAAIMRLAAPTATTEDREAARVSLATLLTERRVSNEGRRYLREFAERRRWTLAVADGGVAR